MTTFIKNKKQQVIFRIEKNKPTIFLSKYGIRNLSTDFCFFRITPHQINGKVPNYSEVLNCMEHNIPELIEILRGEDICVLQLNGMIDDGELPDLFPYIFTGDSHYRYYCPEIAKSLLSPLESFIESWISFDFKKEKFKEMPWGEISLILNGLVIKKDFSDIYETFFKKCWNNKSSIELILSECQTFFETDNDLVYLTVASKLPFSSIVNKIRDKIE